MKFKGYLLIGAGLLSVQLWAQSGRNASLSTDRPSKTLNWKTPLVEKQSGLSSINVLHFESAYYNFSQHYLPIYAERLALPANTTGSEVYLENVVFLPVTSAEASILNSYNSDKRYNLKESIEVKTHLTWFRKKPFAWVEFIPFRRNQITGQIEKLISFELKLISKTQLPAEKKINKINYAANSVLSTGTWHKISVTADGIYKMDKKFLDDLGIPTDSIDPRNIRIYGNGGGQLPFANSAFRHDDLQENSIRVVGESDGQFDSTDYVLFYGQGQHRWKYSYLDNKFHHNLNIYSDTTYYFINCDLGLGKRIQTQSSSSAAPTHTVSSFDDYVFHEIESNNLLKSGRIFLGETFDIINTYNYNFSFPNILTNEKAYARVELAARRDPPGTDFSWSAGGTSSNLTIAGVATLNIYGTYYRLNWDSVNFYPGSSTIPVSITKITASPAIGWLNHIELNVRRSLSLTGNQMPFRDIRSSDTGNVAQFMVSNMAANSEVWEVTDPVNVKLQAGNLSGNIFDFTLNTDTLREFIAFDGAAFLSPKKVGSVPNQDLHGLPQSDYLIVTHPSFLSQAKELADIHRTHDSMIVSVVTTEEVYNEFSSGAQDVSAIRDFTRMFYERAPDSTQLPRYLLLFGRGSYNLKSVVNNTNYVPSYQSLNSTDPTISYPSDDFFGMLDSAEGQWDYTSDVLDLGVGRLPVKTSSEADVVVGKIKTYLSVPGTIEQGNSCSTDLCYGLGDWMNVLTFVADDEDNGDHQKQADQIANKVDTTHRNYNIDKIYFDAYQQVATPGGERYTDATNAFMKRMERGTLLVNYTGHGGELGWAHERFLEIFHINSWKNKCRLPLFFTATCEFSRWDDPARVSAGELTFLHPDGGSIGLMSTTRVVYSIPNFILNDNYFDYTFTPMANGEMPRLGDLQMQTKNSMTPNQINHRNFSLLSDPALSLNYPEYSVATTQINGNPVVTSQPDTARALSLVTIRGELRDGSNNLMSNFNGIIYPSVYDKASKITTLSNDGPSNSPAFNFYLQKNLLFKGKASVTNGQFSFSFMVPKDIAYNFGFGRVSYYAHNGTEDAAGYFEDFIVGGTDSTAAADAIGPQVKLYMNDDKFVFGGTTDNKPKIFAVVEDASGINTSGTSIGHDLTAVLDEEQTKPIILNDYYESDLDDYKKGSIRYPLSDLSEGTHTLTVKVWDVHNNSSTTYTEFVVAESADLALKHVLNYPNPFTSKTSFFFEHNRCCTNFDVQIQVFTISGKLVKNIQQFVQMEGFRSEAIEWDGTDNYGDKIGKGVYVYRLRVRTASGETAEQFEKLVILK